MNETEIAGITQELRRLRAEIQELDEGSSQGSETVELDQAKVGRLSRMDALQAQQMALESGRRRQNQLVKIDGALRRIESGEFGCCFICGEEIDVRRLTVDPTSTRCVECIQK